LRQREDESPARASQPVSALDARAAPADPADLPAIWLAALSRVGKAVVSTVYRSCALARVEGADAFVRVPSGVGLTFLEFHRAPMQAALSAALGREVRLVLQADADAAAGRDAEVREARSGVERESAERVPGAGASPGSPAGDADAPEVVRRALELFGGTVAGVRAKRDVPPSV